jgi:hypothetical protein
LIWGDRNVTFFLVDRDGHDGIIAASEVLDISLLKRIFERFDHGFLADSFAFREFIDGGEERCCIHSFKSFR